MMDAHWTELHSAQREWEHYGTATFSSIGTDAHVRDSPVRAPMWGGPPSSVKLPGPALFPQHPAMIDPSSFSFHFPCQYSQCLTESDYLQSSQYQLLTGPAPAPAPSDSSYVSLVSAPRFSYDLYSNTNPGDVPVASFFVPPTVDHQLFLKGQTEFTPHYTHPMLCNMGGGGQEEQVNLHETGPVFHTLKPAPLNRVDVSTQRSLGDHSTSNFGSLTKLNLSETPDQLFLYEKAAQILYEDRDQAPSVKSGTSPPGASGTRRPCRCTKSQCLKLYCDCFANGLMCDNCECTNCFNNTEHQLLRQRAIELRSGRKPDAFKTKIVGWGSRDAKGWHQKGCCCKRSGCLKNYCECYEANVMCTSSCKCAGCRNFDERSEIGISKKAIRDQNRHSPPSKIPLDLVAAVCGYLLSQAEKAERETQSAVVAEQRVLEEFGQRVTELTEALIKKNTP